MRDYFAKIGGRAERLLRLRRDRLDLQATETLEALAHRPASTLCLEPDAETELDRLEQELGARALDPDTADAHAFELLSEQYDAFESYVCEALESCGLELMSAVDFRAGERVRIRDLIRAHAWFDAATNELIDRDDDDGRRRGTLMS